MICNATGITDDRVVKHLTHTSGNMRELEGAIRKLLRESQAESCEVDIAFALEVL